VEIVVNTPLFLRKDDDDWLNEAIQPPTPFEPLEPPDEDDEPSEEPGESDD
jgi:hypothetical protein